MKARNVVCAAALIAAALAALTIGTGTLPSRAEEKVGLVPPSSGQRAPQTRLAQGERKAPESTISVETTLVNLDVLVTDEDGLVLGGLKKENFRVLDNGKVQTITHFDPTSAPITIAMLMEYSGSAYNYFAYKAASWGSNFLNHLDPLDWVALVTYDIKPTVQEDFTRNKAQMQQKLTTLSYPQFHEANMFDAIIDTLDRLDRVKGKKGILMISTGANTLSSATLDDTLKRIKKSDVTIFSVGVAESEYQRAETQISGGPSISYLQAKNQLQAFARLSGGTAWFPRFEGEIPDIFKSVAAFLRSQYSIGFAPGNLAHDGKYHKLKVEIVRPDGSPLIVTNPKGKPQKPRVYTREGYTAPGGPRDD
ncbi:MAG TPA: VWA domain-containing protein [Candidatus Acidoferrales bacterium]|nr:VWA domain-containing protein [Candidatus Acidoferrales bacterium]